MLKKLYPYLRRQRLTMLLTSAFIIIEVIFELFIPLLIKDIINIGIPNADRGYIYWKGFLVIAMASVCMLFGGSASFLAAKAAGGFGGALRRGLFEKIQAASPQSVDQFSTAALSTRITSDSVNVQKSAMLALQFLSRSPILMIIATFMAFSLNKRLASIFLIAIPLLFLCFFIISKIAFPLFYKMLNKLDILNGLVQENVIAMRLIKSFSRSKYETEKFQVGAENLRDKSIKAHTMIVLFWPFSKSIVYASTIIIIWFGGNMAIQGTILTGDLYALLSYIVEALTALVDLAVMMITIVTSFASVRRISEVLSLPDHQTNEQEASEYTVSRGSIDFKDVTFKYYESAPKPVLSNINLSIQPGEMVGIIGSTGSGKSTLAQLVPKLYGVTTGYISIDGINVQDYNVKKLRSAIGYVPQKSVLFSSSIKDNLKWGNPDATEDQIIEACKTAQIHDFIASLPAAYDSVLEQGGANLSGGQRQRLCIARALIRNPSILILDDSTSAVDTETESKILSDLQRYLQNTTILLITQRIKTVINAKRIVVIDEGSVVGSDMHEKLLETNQIYASLYNSQMK